MRQGHMEMETLIPDRRTTSTEPLTPVERIARALLYEGYLLWPYRRSAIKNQRRWTIGGVYPHGFEGAETSGDSQAMQAECLVESAGAPRIEVRLRFLHRIIRQVMEKRGEELVGVDRLDVGDERFLTWDEAVEREVVVQLGEAEPGAKPTNFLLQVPEGREEEPIDGPDGEVVGALVRSWEGLHGVLSVGVESLAEGLHRVRVRLDNTTSAAGLDREAALGRTYIAAHLVLHAEVGEFVSLQDPPEVLRDAAEACRNLGCWPVLAGPTGNRDTILASPVIVPDHPEIAPESPGDLFDGTEIDQLLTLNIMGMTDEEKAEMRASDPHARQILERTEALAPEELWRMFGAVREYRVIEDTG